jgi:quercetin dioxygenase-like cupin family protein
MAPPSDDRPPHPNQLSKNLPGPTAHWTGHDPSTGKSIHVAHNPVDFTAFDHDQLAMHVAYTTRFPADLNDDADMSLHRDKVAAGTLGLVAAGGTVLRYVDFAPGYTCMMHRTQSVDYGIVVEGAVESVLDSGEVQVVRRGDVVVQRATMHAWRNPSETEWCRMIFVLQDCRPVYVKGERVGEDLGEGTEGLPSSGNDQEG